MNTRAPLRTLAGLGAAALVFSGVSAAVAQSTSGTPITHNATPVNATTAHSLTPAQRAKIRAAAEAATSPSKVVKPRQAFIANTKRVNRTPIKRSGRDCIAQAPQQVAQDHANTGQPSQTVVAVPVDGSTSVQNATDRARANQACAHP